MANVQRYRWGPQRRVRGRIAAGKKVEIGDLVGVDLSTDFVVPASDTVNANIATFRGIFAGVLIEGATAGTETTETPCMIGVDGVYEFPLNVALAAESAPGTPLILTTGSTNLLNQVVTVGARASAIALLAREGKAGDLTALIELYSAIFGAPLA